MRALVRRIEAGTPAHRDRAVDGLRALALLAVPTGHWLLGGFTLSADGALHNASPLSAFAPASWILQMLGIFFLVGGCASVLPYRRRAGTTRAWLGSVAAMYFLQYGPYAEAGPSWLSVSDWPGDPRCCSGR